MTSSAAADLFSSVGKASCPTDAASSWRRDRIGASRRLFGKVTRTNDQHNAANNSPSSAGAALARRDAGTFRHRTTRGPDRASPRRQRAGGLEPHAPIFPCPRDDIRQQAERAGELDLAARSEEHTSELQSRENLVCRL